MLIVLSQLPLKLAIPNGVSDEPTIFNVSQMEHLPVTNYKATSSNNTLIYKRRLT